MPLLFALCVPINVSAYFTTNQAAYKIDDTHAVFVLEYKFGHKDNDMYLPMLTERDLLFKNKKRDRVGYTLRTRTGEVTHEGATQGLVLSSAPIVDGMYKLEKGKVHKLWLVVALTTEKDLTASKYALQVEKLPFLMGKDALRLQKLQLNPSELQYYVTPNVKLGTVVNNQ